MHTFARRATAFVMASTLALGALAGCGPAEPKTTAELVERAKAIENIDNYVATENFEIKLSLFGSDINLATSTEYKVASGNSQYTGTAKIADADADIKASGYYVTENGKTTRYDDAGEGAWMKTEDDKLPLAMSIDLTALSADATFAKNGDAYTLTVPGDKFLAAIAKTSEGEMLSAVNEDEEAKKAVADSAATLYFDKEFKLTDLTYAVNFDSKEDDSKEDNGSVGMNIAIDVKISGYGSVDAKAIAVPDDVKTNAKTLEQGVSDTIDAAIASVTSTFNSIGDALSNGQLDLSALLGSEAANVDLNALVGALSGEATTENTTNTQTQTTDAQAQTTEAQNQTEGAAATTTTETSTESTSNAA